MGTVLTCYEDGLRDPDSRICAMYIDHVVRAVSLEAALRPPRKESYVSKVVKALSKERNIKGVCGLCVHFRLPPQSDINCWSMQDLEDEQALLLDSCLTGIVGHP
jgi:hypothetical protein